MVLQENNHRDIFIKKLERKLKDKDLTEHLITFYEKQIEEMVVSLFLYHLNDSVCLSDDYLTKYSFLLKNNHYLEATHKNRLIKTRDISSFELFEETFNHYFDELKKDLVETKNFEKILNDKNEIINEFRKTKHLNEVKSSFLKLRKNFIISKIMDLSTVLFLGICFSLIYQLGLNVITLSIAILFGISFTLIQSSGEYLEKNRFKYNVNKVLPKTFMKSINFISSIYMILYVLGTICLSFITIGMLSKQSHAIFGFENDIISQITIFVISGIASYWEFRKAVYNKRYFMFKDLESKKDKNDIYVFLNYIESKKMHP